MAPSSRLTFVETCEDWSIYRDAHGNDVYLAHGAAMRRLVAFADLDIPELWDAYKGMSVDFPDYLRTLTYEPDCVDDEVQECSRCNAFDLRDEMYYTNDEDGYVCESCNDDYYYCEWCENRYRNTTTTLHDSEVCEYCLSRHYSWCDTCEGYYADSDGCGTEHYDGCDCEAPAQAFVIRNDGEGPLANDTPATVRLPAGVITNEGIQQIRNYLYNNTPADEYAIVCQVAGDLHLLGAEWQTKQGNFTKRLSRHAYKEYGLKISPEAISRIGCIARDHSTAVDFNIEVTRDLNLPPEEFAHEDSCWWQSYASSRCALKSNGGFGLRTFTDRTWGREVSGRAWVMPMRYNEDGLHPTFETLEPDAFIVFNGYGDLSGYAPARMIAHMAGMTYRKISLRIDPMFINSDSGYLVAPEEIAVHYTDGSVCLYTDEHASLYTDEKKELAHA